ILALALNALFAFVLTFVATRVARALEMRELVAYALAMLATIPVALWTMHHVTHYVGHALESLDDGLRAFRDTDFSVRLTAPEDVDDVSRVKTLYNDVADVLRAQRNDIYQKEMLLDTILQRTPIGVVLVNAADRIVYSNAAARELFADGGRIDGHVFADIVARLAAPMREALASSGGAIVTVPADDHDETFHLSQRRFRLNTLEHRLVLVERLTAELRRQEVTVWKNAIRVINHELNNTIAPISSLVHSARLAQQRPERHQKLPEIYETIEERLAFLRTFLESYAQFARLPTPVREPTRWSAILDDVRALYDFRVDGAVQQEALVDRAQMQQVLINLVKNAHESGSDPDEVVVSIQRAVDGTLLRVCDRGRGIPEDVMRQALVPFYTTKPGGSGLGLALCNEIVEAHGGRMRLQAREGGGTMVTCWLP
ncbi:MAG TPA: ATP-binding protein, partial [Thermoanaerobaculia bacterium]|nr:ATP-binding protein [Thermoanaerobaculia bacterium]